VGRATNGIGYRHHPEQALGIVLPVADLHLTLMLQKGGALQVKH